MLDQYPTIYPDGGWEEPYDDPPDPGHQFFLATIEITFVGHNGYTGGGFHGSRLEAIGQSGVRYDTAAGGAYHNPEMPYWPMFPCGAIESDISRTHSSAGIGDTFIGTVCISRPGLQ